MIAPPHGPIGLFRPGASDIKVSNPVLFGVTRARSDAEVGMTTVREPRKLPVVLSPAEVARLLDYPDPAPALGS